MARLELPPTPAEGPLYALEGVGTPRLRGWLTTSATAGAGGRSWEIPRGRPFAPATEATAAPRALVPPPRRRALKRRVHRSGAPRAVLELGALRVDADTRRAEVDGPELALTYSEFEVLHALLAALGGLLSRQRLLDAILGGHEYRDPRAIDVLV